jgi:ribonucleotide monophosphatase NagD (HAD superfamily)
VETIVGKPSPIILDVALAALGVTAADAVMVGDRVETDIAMGRRLGLTTVLLLSGVTRPDDPRIADLRPDLVLGSIADLISSGPSADRSGPSADRSGPSADRG